MRTYNYLSLSLVTLLVFAGALLSREQLKVAAGTSAGASVHVSEACTLGANTTSAHTADVSNNTYTPGIGSTKFTVRCNDSSGFAVYAIGYSNDSYGTTDMIGESTGLTIPTGIDATSGTSSSHWSMLIAKDTSSYLPANLTIENGFNSYHVVPGSYTKVASFPSSTDGINGTGSSFTATYAARISGTQAADTYVGKVKYALVHPNKADDSNKPTVPVSPMAPSDCPENAICYAPNASDVEGSMISEVSGSTLSEISSKYPTAAKQTYACPASGSCSDISSSTTSITLIAPNYKRAGFGFAGWSTDFTATDSSTIYGPNETITITAGSLLPNGMILYPVWIAKDTTDTMQTFSSSRCNSMPQATYSNGTITVPSGSIIALEDERDGNVYTVARLADGSCWMTENLRLANTHTENGSVVDTILTTTNSNHPLNNGTTVTLKNDYANNLISNKLSATNDTWCTTNNAACFDQTMLNTNNTNLGGKNASGVDLISTPGYPINSSTAGQQGTTFSWYSYGNYYNWYSATAGNGTYSKSSGNVSGDLCPTGWHLPYGNSGNSGTNIGNTSGGFYYLAIRMDATSSSNKFRTFPNNFIYSGRWVGSSASGRGNSGYYWSSSAYASSLAYNLYFGGSNVLPGTTNEYKHNGFSVRCVAGGSGS